jgi:hypothetical protein
MVGRLGNRTKDFKIVYIAVNSGFGAGLYDSGER